MHCHLTKCQFFKQLIDPFQHIVCVVAVPLRLVRRRSPLHPRHRRKLPERHPRHRDQTSWTEHQIRYQNLLSLGLGGSSSGSTLDYRLRGPGFDSRRCELGFFSLFSFSCFNQWCVLNQVSRGGATLLFLFFKSKEKWRLRCAA